MIITKLEQRDIPGCREIYNYYVKNTSFSLEETELTADQYEARVAGVTERFPFLVARDDAGNVAGFAYLSDFISYSLSGAAGFCMCGFLARLCPSCLSAQSE